MRDVPAIWDAWRSHSQTGDQRPSTRVTVQKGWTLNTTDPIVGLWTRGPARWYQAEDPALRVETELPNANLMSVQISRSIDDAGTCEITFANTHSPQLGEPENPPGQFGSPGHFTWDHGRSQDARARWGDTPNPWNDVFAPNALLRTYQGFGGSEKTIGEAITDGNLVLNGVWLVDDISIATDGTMSIKCRDMSKLLIDQYIFPPLVPIGLYPLLYKRWITKITAINGADPAGATGEYCNGCHYVTSSTDEYYGQSNTSATGHAPGEAFDISYETGPPIPGTFAHQNTYWLSEPKGSPDDTVWIEFEIENGLATDINEIYLHAWEGNLSYYAWNASLYTVMVSVFENGRWVEPETAAGGITPQGLPFVSTFVAATPAPTAVYHRPRLPRTFRCTKMRLTFSRLLATQEGGFRAGIRKVMACYSPTNGLTPINPLVFAGASIPVNEDDHRGYWQVMGSGQVYAFGDARTYPVNSPNNVPNGPVIGMSAHPTGHGYWILDVSGRVISAGDANWFGDLADAGITSVVDLAPTPSGNGYWLLRNDGWIHSFGDATDQGLGSHSATMPSGAPAIARSLESHPEDQGYWILYTDGIVQAFGAATHYGNANRAGFTLAEYVASIRRTSTGAGYWITSGNGIVQAFGDAPHKGNAADTGNDYANDNWYKGLVWDLLPSAIGNDGYMLQRADGKLEPKGTATGLNYGSIGLGQQIQRFDGNYKDYADIVRELLLWSGFYLYQDPEPASEMPAVQGNVETTGAYAEDDLPVEMFDKKPPMDPIKEIKEIVGYIFFIDAEGGARFESPNWWTMGNFLIAGVDGQRTPYNYLPEIDESVQLLEHNITFSAASARSELIIATENPMPTEAGKDPGKGITQTRITPKTAADLRGLVVPAMWTNAKFLRPDEQRIMADLIDMRMWFARRTANVTSIANPLIDVNDQVRVIERQTGEVFVHYIKSIQFSHDVQSGDYEMSLETHWLGGTPYGQVEYHVACASLPGGDGYWQCTISGQIYAFGNAQVYERHQADSHLGWVVGMRSTPSGLGYYTVDQHGKVLTYGDAVHQGDATPTTQPDTIPASVPINDMALTPSGNGYWLIEQNGTVYPFGDAIFYGQTTNGGRRIPSGSPAFAAAIESHPITQGYWVLWSDGKVDAFNLADFGSATFTGNRPDEAFVCLRRTAEGDGYWVVSSGSDSVQAFGQAVDRGAGAQYPDDQWSYGLIWDMLVNPDGGYALQRADGKLLTFDFDELGVVPAAPVEAFWALVPEDNPAAGTFAFGVSSSTIEFLARTGSPSANNAAASNFAPPTEEAVRGATT